MSVEIDIQHIVIKHSTFPILLTFALKYFALSGIFTKCGAITDGYLMVLSRLLKKAMFHFKFQL